MNAVLWLRARQEEREFAYWSSLVAYEHQDRSFNNRIYLIYLILFFGVWIFVTLTLFAGGGAIILRLFQPLEPAQAAAIFEGLLLGAWSLFGFGQSLRRSPVVFSEQDEVLVCQTPVSRRGLALRWLPMPWIKSAVPFWLIAVTLGFSVAETAMAGAIGAERILEYAGYGLRALLVIIPIHLALYALIWAAGIYRLQKDRERLWPGWLGIAASLLLLALLVGVAFKIPMPAFVGVLSDPLQGGFGIGSLAVALGTGGSAAAAALGLLLWASGPFNLSRAAQETREFEALSAAARYGFTSFSESIRLQRRLGVTRRPSRLPAVSGGAILVWKDILQSWRGVRPASLFVGLRIFLLMFSIPLLPDVGSRGLVFAFWVAHIGGVAVTRLRSDLERWILVRQLPISGRHFLIYELAARVLILVLISLAGLAAGAALFRAPLTSLAALVPVITAGVSGAAAFDVIRRSRIALLLAGSAPTLGVAGILLGVIIAGVPWLLAAAFPGIIGLGLALLAGLGLGVLAFHMAERAYRRIGAG